MHAQDSICIKSPREYDPREALVDAAYGSSLIRKKPRELTWSSQLGEARRRFGKRKRKREEVVNIQSWAVPRTVSNRTVIIPEILLHSSV